MSAAEPHQGLSDPTGPLKSEGYDVYVTFNLGGVTTAGPEGLDGMKGLLDQMNVAGNMPLTAEQRTANIVAKFADVENWTDARNLDGPEAITFLSQSGYDWVTQPSAA